MNKRFFYSKRFWGIVIMFIGGGLNAIGQVDIGGYLLGIGTILAGYGSVVAKGGWTL